MLPNANFRLESPGLEGSLIVPTPSGSPCACLDLIVAFAFVQDSAECDYGLNAV